MKSLPKKKRPLDFPNPLELSWLPTERGETAKDFGEGVSEGRRIVIECADPFRAVEEVAADDVIGDVGVAETPRLAYKGGGGGGGGSESAEHTLKFRSLSRVVKAPTCPAPDKEEVLFTVSNLLEFASGEGMLEPMIAVFGAPVLVVDGHETGLDEMLTMLLVV